MADLCQWLIDVIVVYKIDRLTRSLADFARMKLSACELIRRLCEGLSPRGPLSVT
jgi:DNA invertase Pin-like site-specific DNA recombinase